MLVPPTGFVHTTDLLDVKDGVDRKDVFTIQSANQMKNTTISLCLLVSMLVLSEDALAQIRINPAAGFSASTLSNDPEGAEASARFGYQFGVSLRTQGALYFNPGIYWQRSGTELRTEDEINLEVLQDDINLDAVFLSLLAGFNPA